MDRRERERIMREGGVRDATLLERADERRLAADLVDSPVRGRPLERRLRNFAAPADAYVAALGGPLPYMQRLRAIEDETRAHEERLAETWTEVARECRGDTERFARRWRATADRWSFDAVNQLIEVHNRWYPVEARLAMDPKTGDFVKVGGKPYVRRLLDAAWVLERFPAELDRAAA